ncbi:mki67 fha domain-interacting nucleolar phosphoprotein like protein [Babesia gibsoni]|uniref:Mki67 fha domain-interacting nucleolar phosphoprotein like protein n=1 Tax=Babesia gibsoni TaxID=33632 RepID=A0AAD8PDI7_BABGI|nr:mki67 fha domain-interacting nucleolar phosphoprotein like protein [Babesia gibsoni]
MEDEEEVKSSVIYVGNLPKELTESQIKGYFDQFGKVVKIRLMTSKKTNNSRGYCYIKFEGPKIASIAAEAMNNYFIDGRVLKCNLLHKNDKVKNLFKKGVPVPSRKARLASVAIRTQEEVEQLESKMHAIISAIEHNKPIEPDSQTAQLRSHLEAAIAQMVKKQELLQTDIYEEPIKKYKAALKILPEAVE